MLHDLGLTRISNSLPFTLEAIGLVRVWWALPSLALSSAKPIPPLPAKAERAHGWLAATRDQQVCVRVLVQGG